MPSPRVAILCLALGLGVAGCGAEQPPRTAQPATPTPQIGRKADQPRAGQQLGFPVFATKNTTRVGGADPVSDAAAVAQAVYPGRTVATRPPAVALIDGSSWQAGVVGAVLMAAPLRAPVLLAQDGKLPPATTGALKALSPTGAPRLRSAQVIRVGDAPAPPGLRSRALTGKTPFALARAVDAFRTEVAGKASNNVIVASADAPAYAMPAAAYAAKAGDSVLFVSKDAVPADTKAALANHPRARIYLLGPPSVVSAKAEQALRKLGTVVRIAGPDPAQNSIAFARYLDPNFGWGVVDPGHGLVFASARRPLDAAAAAPLSATGTYGPLLVLDRPAELPRPMQQYLLDIQPGFKKDPVRGVYNRGWVIGDDPAVAPDVQSQIDALLEIVPVDQGGT